MAWRRCRSPPCRRYRAAGYPGVASLDILGNVFPLPKEEEKIERETQKILGSVADGVVAPATFPVSAQCQRVPVEDGHTETVSVRLSGNPGPAEVAATLREFRGMPQQQGLHSAPPHPIEVFEQDDRPQPRLDANRQAGMTASVGRIRSCPVFSVKMLVLGHNLVRGAAAAAMLNAEALLAMDLLPERSKAGTKSRTKTREAGVESDSRVPANA